MFKKGSSGVVSRTTRNFVPVVRALERGVIFPACCEGILRFCQRVVSDCLSVSGVSCLRSSGSSGLPGGS